MRQRLIILIPCIVNWVACVAFIVSRPPMTALLDERDAARRSESIVLSSADPMMFIAERPLRQWNEWHGGESRWVKAVEVLNFPSLVATKAAIDRWSRFERLRGIGSSRSDSWVMAWAYLVLSSLQWFFIGMLIARLTTGRSSGEIATNEPPSRIPT